MAAESIVPQVVDKKGGSCAAIAPKLEPEILISEKSPKNAEGAIKPKIQWTLDERKVVVQDQHLKSIIMSCIPDDIMESVISCEIAKATWTELVHSFEGLRNANHTQTLDLAGIYGRFVYEDNLIQRRYPDSKKALITTPSTTPISTAFFYNDVIQDFQENSDDEVDERTSEEYLRDLDIEFHERALLANSKQVSDDEELKEVKVLMALADDELTMGNNHARNGEWIDITMRKVNILLSMDEDADWQNYLKYINVDLNMTPEHHRQFENSSPYDMLQELRYMFEKQAGVDRFDLIQTFHACKQEEGKSVCSYILKMKGCVEQLERLSYVILQEISAGLILNDLTNDFAGFVRNYNMQNIRKTIGELHALLIEYEKELFSFPNKSWKYDTPPPEDSPLLRSTGSEDTIFDPGIST
ncbi:hypothetical protein Tco_0478531 [Tanacetum coccineum]